MNKRCVAFTKEEYEKCIQLLRNGFRLSTGVVVKPNERIATICLIEAVLGFERIVYFPMLEPLC